MHYLYILKSLKQRWQYIGVTDNLQRRLSQHNQKRVRSTKAYAPFKVLYVETFLNKTSALEREHLLKHNGQQKEILYQKLHLA